VAARKKAPGPALDDAAAWRKEALKQKKGLRKLTDTVQGFLARFDLLMKEPSTVERGKKLALLANQLELANDSARHFTLDLPLKPKAPRESRIVEGPPMDDDPLCQHCGHGQSNHAYGHDDCFRCDRECQEFKGTG